MLPIEDMKKEPPESPCSPKALDFKLFSQSDNGIYLYQFLVLHFTVVDEGEQSMLFCVHF